MELQHSYSKSGSRFDSFLFKQFLRFCSVGVLNTIIDLLLFNVLLWFLPTKNVAMLLLYNSLACAVAAVNSFCWNKYWTFKQKQPVTFGEVVRFAVITVATVVCNDVIVLLLTQRFPYFMANAALGANVLRFCAIGGTLFISFIGMRAWVFVAGISSRKTVLPVVNRLFHKSPHSLTAVLPAYNEEAAIANTVIRTVNALSTMLNDFEVIVVNDGSKDNTRAIVERLAMQDSRVRLINHAKNQGCGAALVTGFESVSKQWVFYMDSDGQFDIYDLARFLPLIDEFDGVFGYRIDRQDTWMRKLNAWGWNQVVRFVFGIKVRDIDCAFKIFRADYFRNYKLEARGAMLLTEVVYKFVRAGYTYAQIGVRHLPREGGKGTGAKPAVILCAFREMFFYANKWFTEEMEGTFGPKSASGHSQSVPYQQPVATSVPGFAQYSQTPIPTVPAYRQAVAPQIPGVGQYPQTSIPVTPAYQQAMATSISSFEQSSQAFAPAPTITSQGDIPITPRLTLPQQSIPKKPLAPVQQRYGSGYSADR